MTSSAVTNKLAGTVRLSAFAVLTLMANSNFTVCRIGKSPDRLFTLENPPGVGGGKAKCISDCSVTKMGGAPHCPS